MNSIFVLILFAYVGPMGDGNSNALATQEYTSLASCQAAGNSAKQMGNGTVKEIKFICTRK